MALKNSLKNYIIDSYELLALKENEKIKIIDARWFLNDLNKGKKELKETDTLFESLMGKKAEYRFKFIQENANFTNQIDI